ncbi:hypothetical protein CI610_00113 [invertebrate metagenome]|uniref:Uncharacterized protein n=1 Tax=invertebrate metagenome TaxID=1711999 RepID=A0A2H9TC98_9ZZZZ
MKKNSIFTIKKIHSLLKVYYHKPFLILTLLLSSQYGNTGLTNNQDTPSNLYSSHDMASGNSSLSEQSFFLALRLCKLIKETQLQLQLPCTRCLTCDNQYAGAPKNKSQHREQKPEWALINFLHIDKLIKEAKIIKEKEEEKSHEDKWSQLSSSAYFNEEHDQQLIINLSQISASFDNIISDIFDLHQCYTPTRKLWIALQFYSLHSGYYLTWPHDMPSPDGSIVRRISPFMFQQFIHLQTELIHCLLSYTTDNQRQSILNGQAILAKFSKDSLMCVIRQMARFGLIPLINKHGNFQHQGYGSLHQDQVYPYYGYKRKMHPFYCCHDNRDTDLNKRIKTLMITFSKENSLPSSENFFHNKSLHKHEDQNIPLAYWSCIHEKNWIIKETIKYMDLKLIDAIYFKEILENYTYLLDDKKASFLGKWKEETNDNLLRLIPPNLDLDPLIVENNSEWIVLIPQLPFSFFW